MDISILNIKNGYISDNFTEKEFLCNCNKCTPDIQNIQSIRNFIYRLQSLRLAFSFPMIINSWYRCPSYNKKSGGSDTSQHLLGIAADISTQEWSGTKKHVFLELAFSMNFIGIGVYSDFIHLDLRDGPRTFWSRE